MERWQFPIVARCGVKHKVHAGISSLLGLLTIGTLVGLTVVLVVIAGQTRPQTKTASGVAASAPTAASELPPDVTAQDEADAIAAVRAYQIAWAKGDRAVSLQYADPNSPGLMRKTRDLSPGVTRTVDKATGIETFSDREYQDWSQATFYLFRWVDRDTAFVGMRGRVVTYYEGTDPATQGWARDVTNENIALPVVRRNGRWLVTYPDATPQLRDDPNARPAPQSTSTPTPSAP